MKEVGRKKINWDSIVTVELSLKELQLIRDAMAATDLKDMKELWRGAPPYQQDDKNMIGETASLILNSYK
jgi:hypothetical protein|nr:MAG TPA: hypothetical protein [Bacteriophage sp.]